VLFERSDKVIARGNFAVWVVVFCVVPVLLSLIGPASLGRSAAIVIGSFALVLIVGQWFLMQRYVRRARDAGMGKTIAYISILPIVNIVTTLILLTKPTKSEIKTNKDTSTT